MVVKFGIKYLEIFKLLKLIIEILLGIFLFVFLMVW